MTSTLHRYARAWSQRPRAAASTYDMLTEVQQVWQRPSRVKYRVKRDTRYCGEPIH